MTPFLQIKPLFLKNLNYKSYNTCLGLYLNGTIPWFTFPSCTLDLPPEVISHLSEVLVLKIFFSENPT